MQAFTSALLSIVILACPLALTGCATSPPPQPALSADMTALSPARTREIAALNAVATRLIDAEASYRNAARMPDNERRVQRSLTALADQRAREREAIQRRVGTLGGEPDQFGSAMGAPGRLMADLQTVVANDTVVALDAVLRAERALMKQVKQRLRETETRASKDLLIKIHGQVAADIRSLERLKAEET